MKNLILCFCLSFYCIGNLSAQSDSIILALEDTLQMQTDSLDIAQTLFDMGERYTKLGNYNQAFEKYEKSLRIRIDSLGEEHLDVGDTYHGFARVNNDLEKVLYLNEKALEIRLSLLGNKHTDVAKSYNNIGSTYGRLGKYKEGMEPYKKALDIWKEAFGKYDPLVAIAYHNIGCTYRDLEKYEKAIESYKEELKIREELSGENHLQVAFVCNHIGFVYHKLGSYESALKFHNRALNIRIDRLHETKLAHSYNNVGIAYFKLSDYESALEFLNKALKIWEDESTANYANLTMVYNNIGNIYSNLGNYEKALEFHNKAFIIGEDELVRNHLNISHAAYSIARVYLSLGNYTEALQWGEKAIEIRIKQLEEGHTFVADCYNLKAGICERLEKYDKAIELNKKALEIWTNKFGENHIHSVYSYRNLAYIYSKLGRYEEALALYEEVLQIRIDKLGKNHPEVITSYTNIARTHQALHNYKTADSIWHIVINQNLKRLNDTYLFLPDNQRLEYSKTFEDVYNNFYSYAAKHGNEDTKRLAAYLLINTKSLALDYAISVRELINNTDDEELKTLHNELNAINRNISQAELMTDEQRKERDWELTAMRDQQEDLTRQLLKNETLRERLYKTPITWQNTQDKLKSKEAILDFVRFYEESDSTWMYYAMLTRKNMSAPQFIRITDQKAITSLLQADNEDGQPSYILSNDNLKKLYQKIWQPLTPYLKGIKTIHLSPSGLLHRVDFDVLQDENDKYLAEQFEFHYYKTMRDFTGKKKTNFLSKRFKRIQYSDAVFFGDINYNSSFEKESPDTSDVEIASNLRDDIEPIPATEKEIRQAGKINEKNGGQSIYITGNDATEDTVKYYSPDIMHFATHGKYLSPLDSLGKRAALQNRLTITSNPLQRSMLLLSGGGDTWISKEYISRADKDGILTAYEVTHLDLSNTKIVVLSACNTGLGDIHDTEGVLGLQSAFKLAGVEHVVVSLWKVNDTATKELMVAFYKNLLNKKQDTPTALRNAKTEMRREGAKPINWAGFILIE